MKVMRTDSLVSGLVFLLKPANLFLPGLVFSGDILVDVSGVSVQIFSSMLIPPNLKGLMSHVRGRRTTKMEFAQLDAGRMRDLVRTYANSRSIASVVSVAEQNTLVFLLFGSNPQSYLSDRMHRMAIDIGREANDTRKYDMLVRFAVYLPFETHTFMREMGLAFSGIIPDETKHVITKLITGILFREPIDPQAELDFVAFSLLCSQWIFEFKSGTERKLRQAGDQLIVFEQKVGMTYQGKTDIPMKSTKEFKTKREMAAILPPVERQERAKSASLHDEIEGLNQRTVQIRKKIRAIQVRTEQQLQQFSFEEAFVRQ
jgi:hypothetical protein